MGETTYTRQIDAAVQRATAIAAKPPAGQSFPREPRFDIRTLDVAALLPDGRLSCQQFQVPDLPDFNAACSAFARGTLLRSPTGQVAVEDLQPGSRLLTAAGGIADVMWIGSSVFVPSVPGGGTAMVRIMPDTFGEHRPDTCLTLGPAARLLRTPHHLRQNASGFRMLTRAREFIDGMQVVDVLPPAPIRLFHICLRQHDVIIAGGMEVESHHPGEDALRSMSQTMQALYLSIFPHLTGVGGFGPLAHPRAPDTEPDLTAA